MRATSGPVARPGVKGGEKASESSQGERASVEETLDNLLVSVRVGGKAILKSMVTKKKKNLHLYNIS